MTNRRIPGLDGLRAISIAIVFVGHYSGYLFGSQEWLSTLFPPMLGVAVFFVISGYLITSLMIDEFSSRDSLDIRGFYIRRLLRLCPALFLYLAVTSMAYLLVDHSVDYSTILSSAFYVSNYYQVAGGADTYFMPTWSLAVEEHYYLFFPIVFLITMRRSQRLTFSILIASVALISVWRFFLAGTFGVDWHDIYLRTDTRVDTILIGALIACLIKFDWLLPVRRILQNDLTILIAVGLLAGSALFRDELFRATFRYTFQAIAIAGVIVCFTTCNDRVSTFARSILELPPLVYVGKISYGIYLWHLTVLMFVVHIAGTISPVTAVGCGMFSVLFAIFSYHFVESYFIGLRQRFGSNVALPPPNRRGTLVASEFVDGPPVPIKK